VEEAYCARTIAAELKDAGVLAIAISANQLRFVTHLDISQEMVDQVIKIIESL
jgi:threonine aldolase